jgi:hypothetical protein
MMIRPEFCGLKVVFLSALALEAAATDSLSHLQSVGHTREWESKKPTEKVF